MAYPTVDAPYGLKPVNLIGGQVFAGSTRMYNITYAYGTDIFYGDFVALVRGNLERISVSTGTAGTLVGIFLGCSYTNPTTKQKQFSQNWVASTAAGDCVAYVCDDPDTVFQAAVCSSGTTIASGARAMIGQNLACINNTGPGLNQVGPATTFEVLTDAQTWVCTFAMLLGRLEVFTLFVVLTPTFWRD